MSSKTNITHNEYLQLVGLLALAEHHNRHLREIEAAVMEITGIKQSDHGSGHVSDAVFSEIDADQLLRNLNITVEKL